MGVYVELIRNTPFIVQLFFIFFGLPSLGVKLSPEVASVIAMVVNLGAYAAEIVRAGIDSTPRARSRRRAAWRMNEWQVFTRVVLPPALGRVWPALVSQIIIVMLGSAVCGQIAAQELSYAANLILSRNFRGFEAYLIATAHLPAAGHRRAASSSTGPGRASSSAAGQGRCHGRLLALGHLPQPAAGGALDGGAVAHRLRRRRAGRAGAAAGPRWRAGRGAQAFVAGYVQLFQGTPLLMQLFLAYFGLALFGINVSAWVAAGVALTLYTSAFLAEIWRGCVNAIPKGQWEAADSLALSFGEQDAPRDRARRRCASRCRRRWASWCR